MTAKSILNKILGAVSITLGLVYFLFPEVLVNILGLNPGNAQAMNVMTLIIRMFAARNLFIGIGMILAKKGLQTHYWLWGFVVMSFMDAAAGIFLQTDNNLRHLAPLWISAIGLLFFVGLSYGLDIAAGFRKDETIRVVPETEKNKPIQPIPAEPLTPSNV